MNMPRRLSCTVTHIRSVTNDWMFNFINLLVPYALQRELLIPFHIEIWNVHWLQLTMWWSRSLERAVLSNKVWKHSKAQYNTDVDDYQAVRTISLFINVPNLRQQQHSSVVWCVWSTTHHITSTQYRISNSVKCWSFPLQIDIEAIGTSDKIQRLTIASKLF